MSTNHETKSAKSGNALQDKYDPDRSSFTLEGVGRMQRHGVVTVLFDLEDDNKTVPFSTTLGRTSDGHKYVVGKVKFDGGGKLIPEPKKVLEPTRTPAPPAPKAEPEPSVDLGPKLMPEPDPEPEEDDAPSAEAMGV